MINFKTVTLEDREIFKKYYKFENSIGSHYSFTNALIWQKGYDIKYAVIDNFLCVSVNFTGKPFYTFPAGEGNVDVPLNKLIKDNNKATVFTQLSGEEAEYLKVNFGFNISVNHDIAEYVYETEKLINLSGKTYHQKEKSFEFLYKKLSIYF